MFIKLQHLHHAGTLYLNPRHIASFTRYPGHQGTDVRTADGSSFPVEETPQQIGAMMSEMSQITPIARSRTDQ